jgi:hypothetical protein
MMGDMWKYRRARWSQRTREDKVGSLKNPPIVLVNAVSFINQLVWPCGVACCRAQLADKELQ